jgi:cytochrome b pre-mRNA-processing protein 3
MIFAQWRARRASKALIEQILGEIVAAARRPALYEALGAPDRIDGRFELLTLHAGLVLRRLAGLGGLADGIAQDLVNSVFTHFDDTLREMGLSDIAVAKRLKAMGSAFYGRNAAYAAALDDGSAADLAAALARNVYGAAGSEAGPRAEALAHHVASLDAALAAIPIEAFATGHFRFPPGLIAAGDRHD